MSRWVIWHFRTIPDLSGILAHLRPSAIRPARQMTHIDRTYRISRDLVDPRPNHVQGRQQVHLRPDAGREAAGMATPVTHRAARAREGDPAGTHPSSSLFLSPSVDLLARSFAQLDVATTKARQQLKQLANKGDIKSARLLAREVVRTQRQKQRLTVGKARLGSVQMQMQHQAGELYPLDDVSY